MIWLGVVVGDGCRGMVVGCRGIAPGDLAGAVLVDPGNGLGGLCRGGSDGASGDGFGGIGPGVFWGGLFGNTLLNFGKPGQGSKAGMFLLVEFGRIKPGGLGQGVFGGWFWGDPAAGR